MTDIKQVSDWALTIAAEAAGSKLHHYERMSDDNRLAQSIEAHARAIEQHEAFRKEVSDAVEQNWSGSNFGPPAFLARFIITKPDPLVEALDEALWEVSNVKLTDRELRAVSLRLNAKCGGKIEGEG